MNRRLVFGLASLAVIAFAVLIACSSPSGPPPVIAAPSSPRSPAPGGNVSTTPVALHAPGRAGPLMLTGTPLATQFPDEPVVASISLGDHVAINEPVTATITVCVAEDRQQVKVMLGSVGNMPVGLENVQSQMVGDLRAGECAPVTFTFRFPATGVYDLGVAVDERTARIYNNGLSIAVTDRGIVFNPTAPPPPPHNVATQVLVTGVPLVTITGIPQMPEPTATPEPGPERGSPGGTPSGAVPGLAPGAASAVKSCDPGNPNNCAGTVSPHGYVYYQDRDGFLHPASYIMVKIYDRDAILADDDFLGTALTRADGYWELPGICNRDESGDPNDHCDLYMEVDSVYEDPAPGNYRSVVDLGGSSYGMSMLPDVRSNVSDGIYDYPMQTITQSNFPDYYRSVWLLEDANRAWSYVATQAPAVDPPPKATPGQLVVRWQRYQSQYSTCQGSCYVNSSAFIADDGAGASSPDTVVHELGHLFYHRASGLSDNDCPQGHIPTNPYTQLCAWSEGWADYFALQVNNDPCYEPVFWQSCPTGGNWEKESWGDGNALGDTVEKRVASALLDLTDPQAAPLPTADPNWTGNEGADNLSAGFWRPWRIIRHATEPNEEHSYHDFYDHWNAYWDGSSYWGTSAPIRLISYQNTIDYGAGLTNLPSVLKTYGGGGAATKAPGTWVSSLNLRNPGAAQVQGGVLFFDAAGSLAGSLSLGEGLAGGGSASYYVPSLGLANGAYAAVVASDPSPLQVVTNLTSSGPATAGAYSGFPAAQTSTDLWFSGLYKNYYGYNSELIIQNVDSVPANNVAIAFYNASQNNPVAVLSPPTIASIPAHASLTVALQDYAAVPSGNTNGLLSARVFSNSTLKLAGVANAWSAAFNSRFANYSGQVAGATRLYVPSLTKYYYNFVSSLTVQNLHPDQTASVRITYSNGATSNADIAPHHAAAWYIPSDGRLPQGNAAGLFAATIDSLNGQPIAAIVNHEDTARGSLAIYNVPASAGTALDCPVVLKSYYGWFSSETVQNVGTAPTNIRITYSSGQSKVWNNVPINTPVNFIELDSAGSVLPDGSSVSARITSESGQPLAAIVQENSNDLYATTPGDYLLSYSCTPE